MGKIGSKAILVDSYKGELEDQFGGCRGRAAGPLRARTPRKLRRGGGVKPVRP
jgi:hypothetical protein